MNVSNQMFLFDNTGEFQDTEKILNSVSLVLIKKTLGRFLSSSPVEIASGKVRGASKACLFKSKGHSKIILDKSKLGNKNILIIRNILLESCNALYNDKRKEVAKALKISLESSSSISTTDLERLQIGRIGSKDALELQKRINGLQSKNLSKEECKKAIRKLAYETTEYYAMRYFDSICDLLQDSGIKIPKKRFTSLEQYLRIQEASGHTDLY